MAPPCYSDLGKSARDLLSKGYHFGLWKLEAKTQSDFGMKFKLNGAHNTDNGNVHAGLESEYNVKDYGLKFVEKWNTDNVISLESTLENKPVDGLKFVLDGSFNPSTGHRRAVLKSSYKAEYVNTNLNVDMTTGPTVTGAAVVGYKGWMAGYQMGFNAAKSQLTSNNFSMGLEGSDFSGFVSVNDGQEFSGSVHNKVSKDVETGVTVGWSASSSAASLNFGVKYAVSDDTTLRAKISNQSHLGLSLQQKLKDGMSLTLSSNIDAKNFAAGGHRVGLAVDFEQ